MHKVFKKMWKKAEEYADINALLTDELEPMTIEHFAELIVKECIRLCDEVDLAGADDCIDKIKDNFGVE